MVQSYTLNNYLANLLYISIIWLEDLFSLFSTVHFQFLLNSTVLNSLDDSLHIHLNYTNRRKCDQLDNSVFKKIFCWTRLHCLFLTYRGLIGWKSPLVISDDFTHWRRNCILCAISWVRDFLKTLKWKVIYFSITCIRDRIANKRNFYTYKV